MRHLCAILLTAGLLVVSFVVYIIICRIFGQRPTMDGFTITLVVALTLQYSYWILGERDVNTEDK